MTALRISELARRTGVPASTLRYYGQLGLLPAARTPAGYRVYDEHAQQRLMFIETAKRLRLSLTAIADLLAVWESDACRTVKHQLRPLLDDRLADTDAALGELQQLREQLSAARARLDELPDRDHRCDPHCAFLLDIQLTPAPPVACSLEEGHYRERITQWRALLEDCRREPAISGMRATLPADRAPALTELVLAEQSCCGFLNFSLTFDGPTISLTVTGPEHAQSLIAQLGGRNHPIGAQA